MLLKIKFCFKARLHLKIHFFTIHFIVQSLKILKMIIFENEMSHGRSEKSKYFLRSEKRRVVVDPYLYAQKWQYLGFRVTAQLL
jgi:hypothetical protein